MKNWKKNQLITHSKPTGHAVYDCDNDGIEPLLPTYVEQEKQEKQTNYSRSTDGVEPLLPTGMN